MLSIRVNVPALFCKPVWIGSRKRKAASGSRYGCIEQKAAKIAKEGR